MEGLTKIENKREGPKIRHMSSGVDNRRGQRISSKKDKRAEQLRQKRSGNILGPSSQLGDWGSAAASAEVITPARVLIFNISGFG